MFVAWLIGVVFGLVGLVVLAWAVSRHQKRKSEQAISHAPAEKGTVQRPVDGANIDTSTPTGTGVDVGLGTATKLSTKLKTKVSTKSGANTDSSAEPSLTASQPLVSEAEPAYKISYVPSHREWSGSSSGALRLKTLTYKQYECLEDARYGFKIVGVKPTERNNEQPHKTRAHGLKTVSSLVRHGFLMPVGTEASDNVNGPSSHVITDHGLNALEVCDVRY